MINLWKKCKIIFKYLFRFDPKLYATKCIGGDNLIKGYLYGRTREGIIVSLNGPSYKIGKDIITLNMSGRHNKYIDTRFDICYVANDEHTLERIK